MKKGKLTLVCAYLLSGTILFSSCIGSFSLFNKLLDWNHNIGDKFVNELVFVALTIVPVYAVAGVADLLVINSIEFWSGDNPVASVGDVKKVKGENGDFTVETIENGYAISKEGSEESMELVFNKETNTWNVVADGVDTKLIKLNNDGTADLYLPCGDSMNVTMDAQGLMAARQAVMSNTYFASR